MYKKIEMKKKGLNEIEKYNSSIKTMKNKVRIMHNNKKFLCSKLSTFYSLKSFLSDSNSQLELEPNFTYYKRKKEKKEKKFALEDSSIIKSRSEWNLKTSNAIKKNPVILKIPVFHFKESIHKPLSCNQTAFFTELLNRKVILKKQKLSKLKINEINMVGSIITDHYNKKFAEKREHNFNPKVKYLNNFFKNDKKQIKKINIIKPFSVDKYDNKKLNKPVYEIIEIGDKKTVYANKIINEKIYRNSNNNLDCHSLMKMHDNIHNLGNVLFAFRTNTGSTMKKIKKINNNKEKLKKIEINKLNSLFLKKLEKKRLDQYISLTQSIYKINSKMEKIGEKYKNYFNSNTNNIKEELNKIEL